MIILAENLGKNMWNGVNNLFIETQENQIIMNGINGIKENKMGN